MIITYKGRPIFILLSPKHSSKKWIVSIPLLGRLVKMMELNDYNLQGKAYFYSIIS